MRLLLHIAGYGLLPLLLLAGCSQPETPPYSGLKIGQPYQIYGRWYKPAYVSHYDETGIASWYGPGFHGGRTANGERYDQDAMTGAHRTLPLPSIVRVTNLENGKSTLVKINDRGPFAHNRLIDLSRAAAARLGILKNGTAHVRVQFLDQETREYVENLARGKQYAMNSFTHVNPQEASERQQEAEAAQLQVHDVTHSYAPAPEPPLGSAAIAGGTAMTVQSAELPPPIVVQPAPNSTSTYSPANTVFAVVDDPNVSDMVAPSAPHATMQQEPNAGVGQRVSQVRAQPVVTPQYYVQAGTYGLHTNAERMVSKLSTAGAAQAMEIESGNKKLYRVMMGPYYSQEDAKNILSKLNLMGISDAKITHN